MSKGFNDIAIAKVTEDLKPENEWHREPIEQMKANWQDCKIQLIGIANEGYAGIIHSSFNAG